MKKNKLSVLLLSSIILVTACSKQKNTNETVETNKQSSQEVVTDSKVTSSEKSEIEPKSSESADSSEPSPEKISSDKVKTEEPASEPVKEETIEPPEPLPKYHPDSETTAAEVGAQPTEVKEGEAVDSNAKIPASEQY